jgi:ribosomal protein S21
VLFLRQIKRLPQEQQNQVVRLREHYDKHSAFSKQAAEAEAYRKKKKVRWSAVRRALLAFRLVHVLVFILPVMQRAHFFFSLFYHVASCIRHTSLILF